MRIVIDTNVVASALFFGGKPRELIELLVSRKLEAFATVDILTEYRETIDELCSRYPIKPVHPPLATIISAMQLVAPVSKLQICRDPDDNKFIECAVDANCLFVVSGDKDLLVVKAYEGIQIVTVAEFLLYYRL